MSDEQSGWAAPGDGPGTTAPGPSGAAAPPPPPPPPGAQPGYPAQSGYPGPAYGSAPTQALYANYRPGIIPIRPLSMGDIFSGAIAAIRANPAATLGLGALVMLILTAPASLLGAYLFQHGSGAMSMLENDELPSPEDFASLFAAYLPTLASSFAVILMSAFTATVIGRAALGRRAGFSETWESTRGRLGAVVGSTLLLWIPVILVAVGLGALIAVLAFASVGANDDPGSVLGAVLLFLLLVLVIGIAALFLATRFGLASSAIVLEDLGPVAGLRRSWRLTKRGFWRVLGIRLLVSILVAIVSAVISTPVSSIAQAALGAADQSPGQVLSWAVLISSLTSALAGVLLTPFQAGTDTLLYLDQRIRYEGLDVQLLQSIGR